MEEDKLPTKLQFASNGFLYNPKTDSVLLHKRNKHASNDAGKWSIFGGRSEEGESPQDCFIREMNEELGVNLRHDQLILLGRYPHYLKGQWWYIFYAKSTLPKSAMKLKEGAGFNWISLDKVFDFDLSDDVRRFLKHFVNVLDRDIQCIKDIVVQKFSPKKWWEQNWSAWLALAISIVGILWSIKTYRELLPLQKANIVIESIKLDILCGRLEGDEVLCEYRPTISNIGKATAENIKLKMYRISNNEQDPGLLLYNEELGKKLHAGSSAQFSNANFNGKSNKDVVFLIGRIEYEDEIGNKSNEDFWFHYILGGDKLFVTTKGVRNQIGDDRLKNLFSGKVGGNEGDEKLLNLLESN